MRQRYGELNITVRIRRSRDTIEWGIDSPEAGCGGFHSELTVLFQTLAESIRRKWNHEGELDGWRDDDGGTP